MKTLETERLILRPFEETDFEAVHAYASVAENVQYMIWGPNKESEAMGHSTKLYLYGDSIIYGNIGIVAGGGNTMETVTEILDNNVKVLITGITVNNDISSEVHRCEKANGINV